MNHTGTRRVVVRALLSAMLIGILALAAVAPSALGGDMPFESKIRLTDRFPAFHGKVKSDSDQCIANRKVRMFKEKPGADKVLGKTRTDYAGKWQVLKEPGSGVYYAKVNQYSNESLNLSCLPDVSKKVVID